jgi:hypothetical protein
MENVNGCVACVRFRNAGTVWASTFLEDAQTFDTCHYLQGAREGCRPVRQTARLSRTNRFRFLIAVTICGGDHSSDEQVFIGLSALVFVGRLSIAVSGEAENLPSRGILA